MAERHDAIVALAHEHGPCSVRHIYYAGIGEIPNITKNDSGYGKVQRAVLELRRSGRIPFHLITDNTRWMRKPRTWSSLEDALRHTALTYRRDLWVDNEYRVDWPVDTESLEQLAVLLEAARKFRELDEFVLAA